MSLGRIDSKDTAERHRPKSTSGSLTCGKPCPWQPSFVWGEVLFLLCHQCSREQVLRSFPAPPVEPEHRTQENPGRFSSRSQEVGSGARSQRIPNLKTFLMDSRDDNDVSERIRPEFRSSRGFFKRIVLVGLGRSWFFSFFKVWVCTHVCRYVFTYA